MPADGITVNNSRDADVEKARLWRLFRFMLGVMAFYLLLVFFDYEHETILLILGAACFMIWVLYMFIVVILLGCGSSEPLEAEERGLTMNDQGGENNESSSSDVFPFSFARTSQQIRSVQDPITPGTSPSDGHYEIVYNAIVFGKTVRSQGKLILHFKDENNGWSISGSSESISGSRLISEGFVNSMGQMYWIVDEGSGDPCMYRGVFEIASYALWDGDFQSVGSSTRANGRIVRLQKINDDGTAADSIASPRQSSRTVHCQEVEMKSFE